MTPPPSLHRRDWLRLRSVPPRARRSEAGPGPSTDEPRGPKPKDNETLLLRARRAAMGSHFEIMMSPQVPGASALAMGTLDLIDELERQMTVYRDDSEISRLNATAHRGPVVVEPRLFRLLAQAVDLSERTDGAYDITTGALSLAWGFTRGPKRVPDPETLADARARTGCRHLILDRDAETIAFDRPGVLINLGSIGKGHAVDRAAERVRDHWWPTSALIHGGRSSVYALGSPPGSLGGRWEIGLSNPFDPERPLGVIRLRNRGMGTSGASYQWFESGGTRYGHILDPRIGAPAPLDGPAGVTVLAPTAAEADALSTAFTLLGPEWAAAFVRERPEVSAIFVYPPDEAEASEPRLEAESAASSRFSPVPRVWILGLGPEDFVPDPAAASFCVSLSELRSHPGNPSSKERLP